MSQPSSSLKRSLTPSSSDIEEQSSNTFVSHREKTGNSILQQLRDCEAQGILYLRDQDVASKCEFMFDKTSNGSILIRKDPSSQPTEILLAGVFEIDPQDFFFTSDAKYSSSNTLCRFDQVKPHCRLQPVRRHPTFSFSLKDFPTVVSNIQTIEKLSPNKKRTRQC
jgi:hypothetical protein